MSEDSKPWWWKVGASLAFLFAMLGGITLLWVLGNMILVYRGG